MDRNYWIILILVAAGALMTLIATILAAIRTQRFRDATSITQERIIQLNAEIDSSINNVKEINLSIANLQEQIKDVSEENRNLSKSNLELNKEISDITNKVGKAQKDLTAIVEEAKGLTKAIHDFQTGGDSFAYVDFFYDDHRSIEPYGMVYFTLKINGKYPLRNINLFFSDHLNRKMDGSKKKYLKIDKNLESRVKNLKIFETGFSCDIDYLRPNQAIGIGQLQASELENIYNYVIIVSSDNGKTMQYLMNCDIANGKDSFSQIVNYEDRKEIALIDKGDNIKLNQFGRPNKYPKFPNKDELD